MDKKYYTLEFPTKADPAYDEQLLKLYASKLKGLAPLYDKGVGGMCLGEEEYQSVQDLFRVFNDVVSLPENYHGEDIPQMSDGKTIGCMLDEGDLKESDKNKTKVFLRNTYSELMNSEEGESLGEVAVAVAHTLFVNKWMPFDELYSGDNPMSINYIRLSLVSEGDVFVEVELTCKNKCYLDEDIEIDEETRVPNIAEVKELVNG